MAKRVTSTKDEAAKSKVDTLLKDVVATKKEEKVDAVEKSTKDKGNKWLEEQVELLTKENEQLKYELKKAFDEMTLLKNSPDAPVDVDEIKNGVRKLFKDLDDNYQGRNPNRTRYLRADVRILLEKFLGTFPFLLKK